MLLGPCSREHTYPVPPYIGSIQARASSEDLLSLNSRSATDVPAVEVYGVRAESESADAGSLRHKVRRQRKQPGE